ncbi:MAG: hypothetical protein KA281_14435 [Bacteroidia bacterium]|jgi:hypothetical protein|nr:hypothetical protein [Bacteroidia bacterium]
MKKQSYSNHRRYIPLYHYILLTLIVSLLIASVVNIMNLLEADLIEKANLFTSVLFALVSLIFGIMYYYMRAFALRVQDRAIRSEENFRHFLLTGKPMDSRLRMSQIIALRFAPDDEFIILCKEAVEKQLTKDEIKKAVTRWKGDYHRA